LGSTRACNSGTHQEKKKNKVRVSGTTKERPIVIDNNKDDPVLVDEDHSQEDVFNNYNNDLALMDKSHQIMEWCKNPMDLAMKKTWMKLHPSYGQSLFQMRVSHRDASSSQAIQAIVYQFLHPIPTQINWSLGRFLKQQNITTRKRELKQLERIITLWKTSSRKPNH
jgi:hypothetical protein